MSIIEDSGTSYKYLGTIRVKEKMKEGYPEIKNSVYLVKLDRFFQIIESNELKDMTNRDIYQSYTTGFEDCRLIDDKSFTAVVLDNTNDWVPQVVLCKFNKENYEINEVVSFTSLHETQSPQKNWIVLNKTNQNLFLEKDKVYLICIRVVQEHHYQFSLFVTLNIQYKITGISGPFTFKEATNNEHYEMCMSLIESNKKIIASVSCNDNDINIISYDYDYILSLVNNKL
jgi:hypothetical protein